MLTDSQKAKVLTLEGLDSYNTALKSNVLDNLVASVQHDSTNKKLTYTMLGGGSQDICTDATIAAAVTVSNNAQTLAWNTSKTIATVNGTDITVKLPANPNTDSNTATLQVGSTADRKINTAETTGSYIQFTGGTNKITVGDGTNSFDVAITPSISNNVTGSGLTNNAIVLGGGSSAVKTSSKTIETTLSATSDAAVPTSKAVATYVSGQLTSALRYKGTIGSSGATVTALPASHSVGDVYVVKTAGTYAGKAVEVGDYIICNTAGTTASDAHWDVINGENQVENKSASLAAAGSSATIATIDGTDITITTPSTWTGLDKVGTVTSVTPGVGIMNGTGTSAITSSGTLKVALVSETKDGSAATAPSGTTNGLVPVKLDKNGKLAVLVPGYGTASASANGLMTSAHYSKLDAIEYATTSDVQSIFSAS